MLSVVVPVYNEEESISNFFSVLKSELSRIDERHEVIFVDDGSTDKSLDIILDLIKNKREFKAFSFRRNLGKAEALTFGFQKATGDKIVTLDADLQDNPSEIINFIEKSKEGFDVVCGYRKDRKDSSNMKFISKLFNNFLNFIYKIDIHDYNCGFKFYTSDAAKSLRLYGGMHRFIPLLVHQSGFAVTEIAVTHDKRRYGKSKYGFSKIWKDLPDMFTMLFLVRYGTRPLHFFGSVGLFLFGLGFIFLSYLSFVWIMGESIGRRPLLNISILLMLGGMQIFFTGFLAELLLNIVKRDYKIPQLRYKSEN